MNRKTHLADILSAKWLIDPNIAQSYYPLVFGLLTSENNANSNVLDNVRDLVPVTSAAKNVYHISEFGEAAPPENATPNSIAVLQMLGVVTKYDQFCGNAGTVTKANLLERALANPNIKAVVIQFDSGGGEGGAIEHLTHVIRAAQKPVVAFVDGMAASAAYWIASACDRIVMFGTRSQVGSIGAYVSFPDFTKHYEQIGIEIKTIYAPQSTLKNKAFEDALKNDNKAMEAALSELVDVFTSSVKEYRPEIQNDTNDTIFKGAMFSTAQAIKLGMADDIGSMADAINIAMQMADSSQPINNFNTMKTIIIGRNTALLAALNVTLPDGATSVEVDFTEATQQEINTALANSAAELVTAQEALSASVASLSQANDALAAITAERDALQARLDKTPAATPAAVVADADNIPNAGAKPNDFKSQADIDLEEMMKGNTDLPN